MLPITLHPEPENFDAKVRQPGKKLLKKPPKEHTHLWRAFIPALYNAYGGICAYYGYFMDVNSHQYNTDHFKPR